MDAGILVGLSVTSWRRRYPPSRLAVAQGDLALRMRNQIAVDLLDRTGEFVVDDEPVLISAGTEVSKRTTGEGLPQPGWLVLTSQRLIFATGIDKRSTEVLLADVTVTHLEDGWMTIAWRAKGAVEARSLGFKPKTRLLREIVARLDIPIAEGGAGPATPRHGGARQRLARATSMIRRDR